MKIKLLGLLALGLVASTAWADNCSTTIEATDSMQFNKSNIVIPSSCDAFTVELKHTGSLNRSVMGHNWVLTKADDEHGVISSGAKAGLDNDYVDPNDDRVIAHTDLIGGGDSDSVTFNVGDLDSGTDYAFFCSFPGHEALMRGSLSVK